MRAPFSLFAVVVFVKILEIGKRDNELARRLGLPDCVSPLPSPGGDEAAPA